MSSIYRSGTLKRMISVALLLVSLLTAGSVADSTKGVIFKRLYSADPCEDKVLVFATEIDSASEIAHRFRLNSTDTIFTAYGGSGSPIWEGLKQVDVRVELFFLRQQASVILKTLGRFLSSITVELYYEFNIDTKDYLFYFFIDRQVVSFYQGGRVHYNGTHELDPAIVQVVKNYGSGINVGYLKRYTPHLQGKWPGYCRYVKASGNITDGEYALWYDRSTGEAMCSIESRLPWYHSVLFNSSVATNVTRAYDRTKKTHLTLGSAKFPAGTITVCNITFPDGMIALQTGVLEKAPIATVAPTTYRIETSPSGSFPSSFPVPSVERTPGPNGTGEEIDDGLGEAGESVASGAGTAAAAVLVTLVLLAVGGGGVYVYRNRLLTFYSRFRRVPTEG